VPRRFNSVVLLVSVCCACSKSYGELTAAAAEAAAEAAAGKDGVVDGATSTVAWRRVLDFLQVCPVTNKLRAIHFNRLLKRPTHRTTKNLFVFFGSSSQLMIKRTCDHAVIACVNVLTLRAQHGTAATAASGQRRAAGAAPLWTAEALFLALDADGNGKRARTLAHFSAL